MLKFGETNMNRVLVILGCIFCLVSTAGAANQKTLGKFTLAPGEKKTVSVSATTETKVGFTSEISIEQAQKCEHMCVKMWVVGKEDMSMASAMGGSLGATPTKGKIEVVFENVEKFPIPIETFRE
jgi:hypothetical protein